MKYTEPELLEQARSKYFPGVVYLSGGGRKETVPKDITFATKWMSGDNIYIRECGGLIYNNGVWAEIIYSPNITYELY